MKNEPIVIERTFDAPVELLWKAITDKDEMKKWYFDLKQFRPEPGFQFSFEGGTEDKTYLHHCTVIDAVENKKLSHSWRYEGFEGDSVVTWSLQPIGAKTKLTLTHAGVETFPNNPDFAKKNFIQGWMSIINDSLTSYIENSKIKS